MLVGEIENLRLTSFFTMPNADRENEDFQDRPLSQKTQHAAEGKIRRRPKNAKPHGPEGFKTMAPRSWNETLSFTTVFTKRSGEKGPKHERKRMFLGMKAALKKGSNSLIELYNYCKNMNSLKYQYSFLLI